MPRDELIRLDVPVMGVDYSWGRPAPIAIIRAGYRFVCRYLTRDTTGKALTVEEAQALLAVGACIVTVFEDAPNRAKGGASLGQLDGAFAHEEAHACGMPEGRPIFYAVDYDAPAADFGPISEYLHAAGQQTPGHPVGIYGDAAVCAYMMASGAAQYAWQTAAWSKGAVDLGIALFQMVESITVGGVTVDLNSAHLKDYGQWPYPALPAPTNTTNQLEDSMAAYAVTCDPGQERFVAIPPPHGGAIPWGDVWVSLACDFGPIPVRVAILNGGKARAWGPGADQAGVCQVPQGRAFVMQMQQGDDGVTLNNLGQHSVTALVEARAVA